MTKQKFIFILLGSLLVLLIAYLAFAVKWQKVESEVGLSKKASREPLLASIELLKQHNKALTRLSSQEQKSFVIKDLEQSSIMIDESALLEHENLAEQLLSWVEAGGHLIYVLAKNREQLNLDNNLILDASQVTVSPNDNFYFARWFNAEPPVNLLLDTDQGQLELHLSYRHYYQTCSGNGYHRIQPSGDDDEELSEEKNQILLCELGYGNGYITYLPSIDLLSNYGLRHLDHGAFLLWLIGTNQNLYYMPSLQAPSWLAQLWQWSWQLVILLTSLLVLTMWHFAVRLGQPKTPFFEQKAPFIQHINALGHFLFKHQHHSYAKTTLVHDIEQRMAKRNPRFMQLTLEQKVALISQLSGKEQQAIMHLFTQPMPEDEVLRTQYIELFKALRKSL